MNKKGLIWVILFALLVMPIRCIAEDSSDDITDKIIIHTEEVLLHESSYKRSSFFNLRIYNNDNVAYRLNSLSCVFSIDDKVKVKDIYKYYLKENDTEGRFPYTFDTHIFAILSCLTPVTYVMFWSALDDASEDKYDLFIKQPIKSIILIPNNIVYKVKEGQRNKKVRNELKKYFKMTDIIDYKAMENMIIEPGEEVIIPIATKDSFIILENVETHKEYRFDNGEIYYLPNHN